MRLSVELESRDLISIATYLGDVRLQSSNTLQVSYSLHP